MDLNFKIIFVLIFDTTCSEALSLDFKLLKWAQVSFLKARAIRASFHYFFLGFLAAVD